MTNDLNIFKLIPSLFQFSMINIDYIGKKPGTAIRPMTDRSDSALDTIRKCESETQFVGGHS